MRHLLYAILVIVLTFGLASAAAWAEGQPSVPGQSLSPDSPALRYSPRNWDMTRLPYEAATICTGSFFELNLSPRSGLAEDSYVELLFETSTIGKPLPTVGVSFDGTAPILYPMASSIRVPLTSLTPDNHLMRVTLVNLSEGLEHWRRPFKTGMMFRGLNVNGATVGPRPPAPAKQILFIGDSITQGVRSRSAAADYTSSVGDDSTLAFSTLTATVLGYDLANVGFGRQGIGVVGNGGIPVAPYSVGYVCAGVPIEPSFQPDFVVVNLGTNDGNPDAATFDYHYKLMLSTLRSLHRSATIICLVPFGGFDKAQVVKAVQGFISDTADTRVVLVDATKWIVINKSWKPTEDTNDGIHPNQVGHKKAADQLIAILSGLIGK